MSKKYGDDNRTPSTLKSDNNRIKDRQSEKNKVFHRLFLQTYSPKGGKVDPEGGPEDSPEDKDVLTYEGVEEGFIEDRQKYFYTRDPGKNLMVEDAIYYRNNEWEDYRFGECVRGKYVSQEFLAKKTEIDRSLVSKMKKTFNSDKIYGEENLVECKKPLPTKKEFLSINNRAFNNFVVGLFERQCFQLSEREEQVLKEFMRHYFTPESIYEYSEGEKRFVVIDLLIEELENLYISNNKLHDFDNKFQNLFTDIADKVYEDVYREDDRIAVFDNETDQIGVGSCFEHYEPLITKTMLFQHLLEILREGHFIQAEKDFATYLDMKVWHSIKKRDKQEELDEERRKQIISTIREVFSRRDAYEESSSNVLEIIISAL